MCGELAVASIRFPSCVHVLCIKWGINKKHSPGVHGRRRRHPNQQCIFGSDVGFFVLFFLFGWGFFGIKKLHVKNIYFCVIYQDN